jgi:hypothetical protein
MSVFRICLNRKGKFPKRHLPTDDGRAKMTLTGKRNASVASITQANTRFGDSAALIVTEDDMMSMAMRVSIASSSSSLRL